MDYGSWTTSMNWFNYLRKQIDDGLRSTWWGRSCNNDVWKQKAIMQYLCLKFSCTWYLRIPGVSTMQRCSCRHSRFFLRIVSSLPRRSKTRHPTRTFFNLNKFIMNFWALECSSLGARRARARDIFVSYCYLKRMNVLVSKEICAISAIFLCLIVVSLENDFTCF